jgi:hypothetical protein
VVEVGVPGGRQWIFLYRVRSTCSVRHIQSAAGTGSYRPASDIELPYGKTSLARIIILFGTRGKLSCSHQLTMSI